MTKWGLRFWTLTKSYESPIFSDQWLCTNTNIYSIICWIMGRGNIYIILYSGHFFISNFSIFLFVCFKTDLFLHTALQWRGMEFCLWKAFLITLTLNGQIKNKYQTMNRKILAHFVLVMDRYIQAEAVYFYFKGTVCRIWWFDCHPYHINTTIGATESQTAAGGTTVLHPAADVKAVSEACCRTAMSVLGYCRNMRLHVEEDRLPMLILS